MVQYRPSSPRDQANIFQFGKKVLPGIFLEYELIAERIWKGYFWIADLEELQKMNASDVYHRRTTAKEVLIRQKEDEFKFPIAGGTAKLSGRDYEFRISTPIQEQSVKGEDLSAEIQGESGESQPVQPTDDAEARTSFWSIQGDFIFIVITTNREFNSVSRRKKHSQFH